MENNCLLCMGNSLFTRRIFEFIGSNGVHFNVILCEECHAELNGALPKRKMQLSAIIGQNALDLGIIDEHGRSNGSFTVEP